ncbi:MAG: hypothetical protein Q9195_001526 [Heterodermia aff. obscurata]
MALEENEAQAVQLATQALQRNEAGQAEDAAKALREAVSLAPQNTKVKEAFDTIQSHDAIHPLLRLCRSWVDQGSESAGKEAVSYLASSAKIPAEVATACLQLLLKNRKCLTLSLADRVASGLLRECAGAKTFLAQRLSESATVVFEEFYGLGDGSAGALANVVLDVTVWSHESIRETNERDIFQLFLAKLMEVGHDHDGKALKGIARLLAADAERLHGLLDEDTFDAILSSLDNRLPIEVRSHATLATAKYLESSETDGQRYLLNFIRNRIARQKSEDLILAFSAAAAIFPLVPSIASSFFLTEGFVPSLVPLLQKKVKFDRIEQAALSMLSAACLDSACRQTIRKYCTPWLQSVVHSGKEKISGDAAVILAKVQGAEARVANGAVVENGGNDIAEKLKQMIVSPILEDQDASIEGLAFSSSQPEVKDQLIKDSGFLENLVQRLNTKNGASKESPRNSIVTFGILTILDNLTRYLPSLSEEQKKMSQLKAYANASPSTAQQSPLDLDAAVTARCSVLINSTTLLPILSRSHNNFSASSTALMLSILLSLTRNPKTRGKLAQQGAAKTLLQTYTSIAGTLPEDHSSRYTASHALARLLISIDPTLIFPPSGSPPLTSTIRPLLTLLDPPPPAPSNSNLSTARDLLPTFESLLALTNLASTPDPEIAEQITRLATPDIEDLLLSNNPLLSRAATELCCNLTASPSGLALFASPTADAKRRLHILLALADAEDVATRRAAGGAVAGVVGAEGGVRNVLLREGGVERVVGLVEDEDEGCVLRGLVALGGVASGEEGRERVLAVGGMERVGAVAAGEEEGDVKSLAGELLGVLRGRGVDGVD